MHDENLRQPEHPAKSTAARRDLDALVEHATRSRAEPVRVLTKGSSGRAPLPSAD
jgi:hypothetical protein